MMAHKLSPIPRFTSYQTFTQSTRTVSDATHGIVSLGRQQSKIQRWIFGMIIGSAPFLLILICWMFVSLCINNLVRLYQYRKNRYRQDIRTNGIRNIPPKINV